MLECGTSFVNLFLFVVAILSCLCHAALLSPAGKGLLYVTFYCVFVTFHYSVLGQVWYLIVSIPDICLLPYFAKGKAFISLLSDPVTFDNV